MGCNRVFNYPYFFTNLARFQPWVSQVPGQSVGPGFKIMCGNPVMLETLFFGVQGETRFRA